MILARLAFGAWLDPDTIARAAPRGGDGRAGDHRRHADESRGGAARRAARSSSLARRASPTRERRRSGSRRVLPTAVRGDQPPRADAAASRNRIEIESDPLGQVALRGPGRRRAATAARCSRTCSRSPPAAAARGRPAAAGRLRRGRHSDATDARTGTSCRDAPRQCPTAHPAVEIDGGPDRRAARGRSARAAPADGAGSTRRCTARRVDAAALPARPSLVERYRRFLPVTDATPALTLGEGFTPLVAAPRLGARIGVPEPAPQARGPEPDRLVQGPGHGRRRRRRRSRRARRSIICASTGNTSAQRGRLRRGGRASRSRSCCRRARSRSASCSRR